MPVKRAMQALLCFLYVYMLRRLRERNDDVLARPGIYMYFQTKDSRSKKWLGNQRSVWNNKPELGRVTHIQVEYIYGNKDERFTTDLTKRAIAFSLEQGSAGQVKSSSVDIST